VERFMIPYGTNYRHRSHNRTFTSHHQYQHTATHRVSRSRFNRGSEVRHHSHRPTHHHFHHHNRHDYFDDYYSDYYYSDDDYVSEYYYDEESEEEKPNRILESKINEFLDKFQQKVIDYVDEQHQISQQQSTKKKVKKLNQEVGLSALSKIPQYKWKKINTNYLKPIPKNLYPKSKVETTLKRICNSLFPKKSPDKRARSNHRKFIFKSIYWDHKDLNNRIRHAVTIVDQEFTEEEQKSFLKEFCSGAAGINGQCGDDAYLQVSMTVNRVISGLFHNSELDDLDPIIFNSIQSNIIEIAQKSFVESGYGNYSENRSIFEKKLQRARKAFKNSPPEITAKKILSEIQSQCLMRPNQWRTYFEERFSAKEFHSSSKGNLGQTLANEMQNTFQLTIKSLMCRMKTLGILKKSLFRLNTDNHADCLELLALCKKLPVEALDDPNLVDQHTMFSAIHQYFKPSKAILVTLAEIARHGKEEQIELIRNILEGTELMSALDIAVSINIDHNQ